MEMIDVLVTWCDVICSDLGDFVIPQHVMNNLMNNLMVYEAHVMQIYHSTITLVSIQRIIYH